ncbi:MAG: flagellar hook-associated protein FlgK [Planctomycetaceae bacterium]|jgi:flagellar hook-associated protein 1 FlgK|nr:flagellar hook-associated protein FlgK [Planctomycetaceae bacterium]
MGLFNSLQVASGALNANSYGIQVVGQNLANVDTPGYVREQVLYSASGTLNKGNAAVGTGVQVNGVIQMIDQYLEERLRSSMSDTMNSSTQSKAYSDLEALIGEFESNGITTSMAEFFNLIGNVLNQPENLSYRQQVAGAGESLAYQISTLSQQLLKIQVDLNRQVEDTAKTINRLTETIQSLNVEIARIEAGKNGSTEAVGLRDQRIAALAELSKIVNIRTHEDAGTGIVSVFCGSTPLIVEGTRREVCVTYNNETDSDLSVAEIRITETKSKLDVTGGTLSGLYKSRDEILGGFSRQLDEYANALINEFNKIFCSGQGLTGYDTLTSLETVSDPNLPLNKSGLTYSPVNGAFNILVHNKISDTTTTNRIDVPLDTTISGDGLTLQGLADAINSVDGVTARITTDNRLEIQVESEDVEFAFSDDTSGVLAALGINVFFTGADAKTIGINSLMLQDPGKFAASSGGIGHDTGNAEFLASMPETAVSKHNNLSVTQLYQNLVNGMTQKAGTVKSLAAADFSYYTTLEMQKQSISGVDIDEETINLLSIQRTYQANARLVTVINEMLESLLNM